MQKLIVYIYVFTFQSCTVQCLGVVINSGVVMYTQVWAAKYLVTWDINGMLAMCWVTDCSLLHWIPLRCVIN